MEKITKQGFLSPFIKGTGLVIKNIKSFLIPALISLPFSMGIGIFSLHQMTRASSLLDAIINGDTFAASTYIQNVFIPLSITQLIEVLFFLLFSIVAFNLSQRGSNLLDKAFEVLVINIPRILLLLLEILGAFFLTILANLIFVSVFSSVLIRAGLPDNIIILCVYIEFIVVYLLIGLLIIFSPLNVLIMGYRPYQAIKASIRLVGSSFFRFFLSFILLFFLAAFLNILIQTPFLKPLSIDFFSMLSGKAANNIEYVLANPFYTFIYAIASAFSFAIVVPFLSSVYIHLFLDILEVYARKHRGDKFS
ncbi:hypothetical protein WKV44_03945 [Spirochaetia bacterium 38H-sp]|uniref:Uncharacterized protein n=1 Tax=Rarispira pelagica TaxID=3141764 RepID=A0ABU9UAJ1_9SPIR